MVEIKRLPCQDRSASLTPSSAAVAADHSPVEHVDDKGGKEEIIRRSWRLRTPSKRIFICGYVPHILIVII